LVIFRTEWLLEGSNPSCSFSPAWGKHLIYGTLFTDCVFYLLQGSCSLPCILTFKIGLLVGDSQKNVPKFNFPFFGKHKSPTLLFAQEGFLLLSSWAFLS